MIIAKLFAFAQRLDLAKPSNIFGSYIVPAGKILHIFANNDLLIHPLTSDLINPRQDQWLIDPLNIRTNSGNC